MGPVSATITIDVPRERVYELVADLANRPAFCDHFMEQFHLQRIESRGIGAAARYRAGAKRFPIWMETVIEELDPPYMVREAGRGSRADRMPVFTAWEMVAGGAESTEVTVSFWTEPTNLFDKLKGALGAARWYRRQYARALRRLRDILEGDQAVEPLRVGGADRI
jgi:hypothetical protein